MTQYAQEHKKELREYQKQYQLDNKEKIREQRKEYVKIHETKFRKYYRQYRKTKRQNDINCRLADNLRGRLYQAIKGDFKSGSAVNDLGIPISDFKLYFECLFYDHPETRRRNDLG